jgi:phosphoribosylamine--glycine ligase
MFVIGGGGREHALVWHLAYTDPNASIYCAPGNAGIASLATCLPVSQQDLPGLAGAAASIEADLTVVGPEAPLVAGVVDVFAARGLAVFGPTAAAARLEGCGATACRPPIIACLTIPWPPPRTRAVFRAARS